MSGRSDRLQREARSGDDLAIDERNVRVEVLIAACIEAVDLAYMKRARVPMWPLGVHCGPGRGFDQLGGGRMVSMRVGDQDMSHRLIPHRIEDRRHVSRIRWPRINDRN